MKQALIDIGSNSMRLTVYETAGTGFHPLFREKVMAGLAGYVEDGRLSPEGIACAYEGLLEFRQTLDSLGIDRRAVFATASLRNIDNTEEAVRAIRVATGFSVEVISGEEEAAFGYLGAMKDLALTRGAFVDVGGASTEAAVFENGRPVAAGSFPVGSLSLYRDCVKKIMPGAASRKRIQEAIQEKIDGDAAFPFDRRSPLVCVGGTARAALKLAKRLYSLPDGCRTLSRAQFSGLCAFLCRDGRDGADLVLKLAPDRIHTIVPGAMILRHMMKRFGADELTVSKYGVREGYLCQKILRDDTHTPITGN